MTRLHEVRRVARITQYIVLTIGVSLIPGISGVQAAIAGSRATDSVDFMVDFSVCELLVPGFPPVEEASSGRYSMRIDGKEVEHGVLPFYFISIPPGLAQELGLPTEAVPNELGLSTPHITRDGNVALVDGQQVSDSAAEFLRLNCRPMNR